MAQRPTLMCPRGMVVAEHYLAAEAGLRMLHAGGNAIDAAVAATLVEGVTPSAASSRRSSTPPTIAASSR